MAWDVVRIRRTVGALREVRVDLFTCTSVMLVCSQDASAR